VIQVWFDGKKMGTLDMSVPKHRRHLTFTEVNDVSGTIREIAFSLNTRSNDVEKIQLARNNWTLEQFIAHQFGVDPSKCWIEEQPMRDAVRVSWPMIVVESLDQYEYLFDQRCFVPD
jgi:hypothetical protein